MIAEAVACLVYSSFFNKGVITSNYLYHFVPFVFLVNWALTALVRYERRRLEKQLDDLENEE